MTKECTIVLVVKKDMLKYYYWKLIHNKIDSKN